MSLNDDIVNIEKPDVICLLTFVVEDFSASLLDTLVFSIKDSRSIINGALSD